VAKISRLLKIIGLLAKYHLLYRALLQKETYNLKEPTNRSHPICIYVYTYRHGKKRASAHAKKCEEGMGGIHSSLPNTFSRPRLLSFCYDDMYIYIYEYLYDSLWVGV